MAEKSMEQRRLGVDLIEAEVKSLNSLDLLSQMVRQLELEQPLRERKSAELAKEHTTVVHGQSVKWRDLILKQPSDMRDLNPEKLLRQYKLALLDLRRRELQAHEAQPAAHVGPPPRQVCCLNRGREAASLLRRQRLGAPMRRVQGPASQCCASAPQALQATPATTGNAKTQGGRLVNMRAQAASAGMT
jgi:hypothetical protein